MTKFGKFAILLALTVCVLGFIFWFSWMPSQKESAYSLVLKWGKKGNGLGEFNGPIGIVVQTDKIYVSDTGNNRIQVFSLEGKFLFSFGKGETDDKILQRPMHMDFHRQQLFVSENGRDRIHVFSPEGESLKIIVPKGEKSEKLDAPGGVSVLNDGSMYIADFYNQRALHLDADGNLIKQIGHTRKIGFLGGNFNYPTDVAVSSIGHIFVADAYNDRIQVFDEKGTLLRKWGGPFAMNLSGSFNGWFKTATGISIDQNNNVYVADFYNNRIQKFNLQGDFLASIELDDNSTDKRINRPTDMEVDSNGNLYVVDFGNNRILKFTQ